MIKLYISDKELSMEEMHIDKNAVTQGDGFKPLGQACLPYTRCSYCLLISQSS